MSKAHPPELKKFMDKKLSIKLNAGRCVTGVLRGFDPFMNLVLDESVEECKDGTRNNIGMVVRQWPNIVPIFHIKNILAGLHDVMRKLNNKINVVQVIRGNSIIMVEALDRL